MGMRILLASTSPRRRELLESAGVKFEVIASPAEEIHDESMVPERLCEANAVLKAAAVASDHPEAVVIGADTLVFIDDRALGKPSLGNLSRRHQREIQMLRPPLHPHVHRFPGHQIKKGVRHIRVIRNAPPADRQNQIILPDSGTGRR